ncbi:uncharacterized protein LOC131607939 [Vicia villosa]|uniref:uncharacterized protein LOC131607939 n=1 Tax=Vicia villosa TaxID=3911 RepID=UPI00273A9499|nr:uncharacterized protein LOC131607939 [Vicia villosa]
MDKKWMNADRLSKEYENGVLEFVKFAVEHVKDAGRMKCPCLGCCYGGRVDADGLKSHLLTHGIDRSYKCWIYHGEKINENVEPGEKSNTTTYAPDDNDTDTYDCDRVKEIAEALEEVKPKSKANNITWIRVEYFDDFKCATYSKSKLDELKEEWCQFMIELKVV